MDHLVFGRGEELSELNQRFLKRKSFLLHGPTGVGKTLLLRSLVPQMPSVLYCETSSSTQVVFRGLAQALLDQGNQRVRRACFNRDGMQAKSAMSLKGIVVNALREANYSIVLDHVKCPSQSFASAIREIIGWCSTPVISVARSSHMEDTGFLQPLYSDRHDRYELTNFGPSWAAQFAETIAMQAGLSASNLKEFLTKVLEFSGGNPGAILAMVKMAKFPKYRFDEHIKITPLYIDFRMNGGAVR